MKKVRFSFLGVLFLSTFVFGKFLILPIEERVKENNLILIGNLVNISKTETDELKLSEATLVVEKVIYGNFVDSANQQLKSGDKIQVKWQNSKTFACQFSFPENEKKIWFLKVNNAGEIESLSPSTTASVNELPEIGKFLKKYKDEDKFTKKILLANNFPAIAQSDSSIKTSEKIVERFCSVKSDKKEFYPITAFLVILFSSLLYYFLYQSRFKIR